MPKMTISEYAAHRGVTRPAVYDALNKGKIVREPDGRIDSEVADRQWPPREAVLLHPRAHRTEAQTVGLIDQAARLQEEHAMRRGAQRVNGAAAGGARVRRDESARNGHGGGEADRGQAQADGMSYLAVRMQHERVRATIAALRLRRERGELVEVAKASQMFAKAARQIRDALQNWPVRIAGPLAAELGVDPHRLQQVLSREIGAFLTEMAEPRLYLD
jgi:phage terminase Nu1 subunit (DNA packaging protein)